MRGNGCSFFFVGGGGGIYIFPHVVVAVCFSYLLARSARSFVCVSVCVCDAVFRKTKQRRRGRLDPGCIRLWSEGAPSGSLEGERRGGEGGKNKEMQIRVAANYIRSAQISEEAFRERESSHGSAADGTERRERR